jgi:rhamnogalacturonyl hydrolase YesR
MRRTTWIIRTAAAIVLVALLSSGPLFAQHAPTAAQQAGIDKDNSRHFGDSPEDGGPMAKGLSAKLKSKDIEKAIHKVGDWELDRAQPYFDRNWTWAALYIGFIQASEATGDTKYRDAVEKYSESVGWAERSRASGPDDGAIGQAYVALYQLNPDDKKIAPTRTSMDEVLTMTENPNRLPWWWCDALFMAPPLWTRMTTVTGDEKYRDYMNKQYWRTSDQLYDTSEHLFSRDASYINKTEANGKKMFWSRGEGWVMAGLARTIETLPQDDSLRAKYVAQLQEMSAKIASLQSPDGLWRAGLLDPDAYGLPENSGSAFMVYAMAWGINHGVLDAKTYKPVVAKGWRGLLSHVYADGRLGCIEQTGAEPAFYRPTASYNYGIGAFLMAGAELDKMTKGHNR